MEQNLFDAAKLFTPPVYRRRKKKKKDAGNADVGKMSLKKNTPREVKNPFLTSDESGSEEELLQLNLNDWLTDEECDNPRANKSATTSKTSNTYVTCLTEQPPVIQQTFHYELSEEEDDGVAVISQGILKAYLTEEETEEVSVVHQETSVIVTTPVQEVSSCEKVHTWLQRLDTPGQAVRCLKMPTPQTDSQGTSSGYPTTDGSQNIFVQQKPFPTSSNSSMYATSRLESSPESSVATQPIVAISQVSRSSSFYFKDKTPWSKSQPLPKVPKKKPTSEKKLSNRSTLTIWSDAKSTLESIQLRIETSEENQENSFSSLLPVERRISDEKSRRRSSTSGAESLPETVPKMSEVYASSDQCLPLSDLTNRSVFNPVLSSTQRDSVFTFSSGNLQYKETINQTLDKTQRLSREKRPSTQERREVVLISSDEEYNCEYGSSDCVSASSNELDNRKNPRTPLKTRLVEVQSSDSEPEEENKVVPESEEELVLATEEDSDQSTHFSPGPSQDTSPPQRSRKTSLQVLRTHKSPQQRRGPVSDSEEDDEELLDQFFKKQKEKRQVEVTPLRESDHSFIVEDDVIYLDSDASEEEQRQFSPSFYLKVLNDQRRALAESDISIKDANWTEVRKQYTQTPTPKGKKKCEGKTPQRDNFQRPTRGFLSSLSGMEDMVLCHAEAVRFVRNFKSTKDDLVERLFSLFNETVFNQKLDPEMSITWNNRLRSTAGFCYNQRKKVDDGSTIRVSRIELSGKILQNAGQLRDTLIHEMCHAATWVIDETLGGHGPAWKKWTRRANRIYPELPEIKRCHTYKIETTYTYKCTVCLYSFGRFSKSLDIERKVCGYCKGKFELIVNGKKQGTPARPPNPFAMFVKENYKVVKQKDMKHKDVMQILSQQFKAAKL